MQEVKMLLKDMKFSEVMELKGQLDEFKANMQTLVIQEPVVYEETMFWKVGTKYLVRTVTMYCLGRLKYFNNKELIFSDASWVADCGRFNNALKTGVLNEVEPFIDDVCVSRDALIDATVWRFDLPREVIE